MGTGAAGGVGVCAFRVGHGVVSMMAMPPQWGHAPLPALDTPAVHLSLRASPPSNFAPEGLERPPRRILA